MSVEFKGMNTSTERAGSSFSGYPMLLFILALLVLGDGWLVYASFVALGFGFSGWMMAAVTLVLEFGAHEDIPMRLALTTTVEGGVSSVGPILVGLSIAALGYAPLSLAAFAALIGSLALMLWRGREPRGSA